MSRISAFNGWQRLWMLLAVLYLMPVAIAFAFYAPTTDSISEKYISQAVESMKKTEPGLPDLSVSEIRGQYKDWSNDEFLTNAVKSWSKRDPDLLQIEQRRQYEIKHLPLQWLKYAGLALLAWIIPAIFVYALGWSVGWVYRGFKSPQR